MKNQGKQSFPRRKAAAKERGSVLRVLLAVLVILLLLGGSVWGWKSFFGGKTAKTNVIYARVVRGTFLHEIAGKGNAQSAKNVDITCQVESAGGTTVIWIIPEGEVVKKGEELVLLDSSDLEDKVSSQQITCNSNSASVASAQASLRTAELSLEEYIEGTFEQSWLTIENDIYSAREEQKQAADNVQYTEKLVQFGYTTPLQLDADRVAEQEKINKVKSDLLQQSVLLKFTSEKEITQLMANIETARATLSSQTYTAELAKSRLDHYLQQLENCVIRAPQDGQVVYANQDTHRMSSESDMIKEGSSVRARQVLIRLPDLTKMQIKAMINESNIAHVKAGMKATIIFDALSSQTFEGTVSKVNQYPEIVWMSSAKDYVTIIDIDNPNEMIRSGLTAQVKIESKKIPDVLMVPVQSILEVAGKKYVLTYNEGIWGYKEVRLGLSNDKQVIIEEGVEEGERIVSGARQYKNKVKIPTASSDQESAAEGENPAANGEEGPTGSPEGLPPGGPDGGMAPPSGGPAPGGFPPGGPSGGMSPPTGGPAPGGFPPGGPNGGMSPPGGGPMPGGFAPGSPNGGMAPPSGGPAPGGFPPPGMENGPNGKPDGGDNQNKRQDRPNLPGEVSVQSDDAEDKALVSEMVAIIKNAEQEKFNKLATLREYFKMTAMELCHEADADANKTIAKEELQEKFPACVPFFEKWDRNGDGTLSRTDLVIGFCSSRIEYNKMESQFSQEQDESNTLKYILKKEPSELFALLDTLGDKFISREDAPETGREVFFDIINRLDANDDEKVNADEMTKGITQFKRLLGQTTGVSGKETQSFGPPPPPPH